MAADVSARGEKGAPCGNFFEREVGGGQLVQGRQVIAERIRVGKFEVANVECLVFAPEYRNASAVLGQSFLGKFVYKIDAVNSKLVMAQLDAPERSERSTSKQAESR